MSYGEIIYARKKVGVNIYGGLGFKVRHNTFSNLKNVSVKPFDPGYFEFDDAGHRKFDKNIFGLNLSLGIKLYYSLKP